ncbi:MAG: dehydratase [Micromonosporaceae bacterium]|nr:dehydratase [Micromonosporaceae bacterium]
MYFEDFSLGQVFVTAARTITETDILTYAYLSGDHTALHTDAEYAKGTIFGERIAHGPLGAVISGGLLVRLGIFEGSALAALEHHWVFKGPIRLNDTIHSRVTIVELRETSDGERGVLQRKVEIVNQRGEVVQTGHAKLLIAKRPEAQAKTAAPTS